MKIAGTLNSIPSVKRTVAVVETASALKEDRPAVVPAEWNDTRTEYPRSLLIHQLFEALAETSPGRVAAVFEDGRLTYAELNERANRLAHYLRRMGVGPEARVGLFIERSLDMIVGLLGILKAGGAYVPLDPSYPKDRLSFMLEDAGIKALVSEDRLAGALANEDTRSICLDRDSDAISNESASNPENLAFPENLCYVIYTSGSTGKPKGVQVSHRAVVNFLTSMRERPGLAPEDVLLSVTTISFDIAALEIFLPLTTGARLVLASREVASNGRRLIAELARSKATVLQATPATWRLLAAARWAGDKRLRIFCGGEALRPELAEQLLDRGAELWNLYGPTETTIWSSVHRVCPQDERISIGRPIANTQIYLLDEAMNPVPVGEAGELHIGGDGVARGYLNRAELASEKFIPDPFGKEPGARLYRTGDLARYMPDGRIECLGRIDQQVKVRGFRIEIGEIESLLARHPLVREAAVAAREDARGESRLVAYLVPESARAFASPRAMWRQLREFAGETLPEYMVPSAFIELEALPLTPNGKVDRNALPAPGETSNDWADQAQGGFLAPRDPLEHQLVQIWEGLFDARPIGVRDSFFDLGGHSLLAARMMDEIERAFGKKLTPDLLHKGATVEYLAGRLLQQEARALQSPIVEIQAGGNLRPFIYLHGDFNGGGFYCMNIARLLGKEQPFYALPPHGTDGSPIPRTFEEMAALHLETLRAFQPKGPYLLGGFCNGALVAYEMARKLEAQGEAVDLLVLIYASAANARYRTLDSLSRTICRMRALGPAEEAETFLKLRGRARTVEQKTRYYSTRLLEISRAGFREQAGFIGRQAKRRLSLIASGTTGANTPQAREGPRLGPGEQVADTSDGPRDFSRRKITDTYNRMMETYMPGEYGGRVTLFWPDEADPEPAGDPSMGWGRVAREVEVYPIAGKHLTCITRHADVLADRLRCSLEKIQGR
ncbi:MAG TPA: amino acid adenylation domain-containing protein [Blastocatellia bacterium]|jgi:amino acid adenylation domain-containing protein|nr:amino acid adenylation domain-containing protein [Blastocatellia bacterium]